jgi:cyclopropane-fatty-acyl-phospholipid synthase
VLDVGCGWGSFAMHAAERYGARVVGITLSPPQVEYARRRAVEAGLAGRVEFHVADYRELRAEPFDAIASIGMVEHVGEGQIDVYAQRLAELLRPGGRLLNHGIAQLQHGDDEEAGPFSDRYVFPDGEPLHLSRVQLALEGAGLVTEHVEGFAEDYAETVRHWTERFESRLDEAIRLGGPERTRVWQVYLHAARRGFMTGFEAVYQMRCRRPLGARGQHADAARPGERDRAGEDEREAGGERQAGQRGGAPLLAEVERFDQHRQEGL